MKDEQKRRAEFGDFQTPDELAHACCRKLASLGISPDTIIEPTCGVGAFVIAAHTVFPQAKEIFGYEINPEYLALLGSRLRGMADTDHVHIGQADFFDKHWENCLATIQSKANLLVLGNFPWVTSSQQGSIGGTNLPAKSNFQGHCGLDAMTGKANFDISEWMLLKVMAWLRQRSGAIGMLVKTAVARKVLVQAQQQNANVAEAFMFNIDAKKSFGAAVDACLLVIRFDPSAGHGGFDYTVYADLDATHGTRIGHRDGRTVANLDAFDATVHLIGKSPQKWRSGVKHDAAAVMEFTRTPAGLRNGLDEVVTLEDTYLYPLLKGSDIGSAKAWRQKFTLVTQRTVGVSTAPIQTLAPRTWQYLLNHAAQLDARASAIYANTARFAVFGIGDYAYRPWKIAICALYKKLEFRLIGPIEGRPVMVDDTVYYISFDHKDEADTALAQLHSDDTRRLLNSMIFWDEKRPIKTAILNLVDFEKVSSPLRQACLI